MRSLDSCLRRNDIYGLWIPAFAGMTYEATGFLPSQE